MLLVLLVLPCLPPSAGTPTPLPTLPSPACPSVGVIGGGVSGGFKQKEGWQEGEHPSSVSSSSSSRRRGRSKSKPNYKQKHFPQTHISQAHSPCTPTTLSGCPAKCAWPLSRVNPLPRSIRVSSSPASPTTTRKASSLAFPGAGFWTLCLDIVVVAALSLRLSSRSPALPPASLHAWLPAP